MSDDYGIGYVWVALKLTAPLLVLSFLISAGVGILALLFLKGANRTIGALFGYCFLFAALGAYIGYGTGASREAIVGTIVPAVLTLLAAAMAYLFNREQAASSIWQVLSVPALVALVISCLIATVIGAKARMIAEASARNDQLCEAHYTAVLAPVCEGLMKKVATEDWFPSSEAGGNLLLSCQTMMLSPHPCSSTFASKDGNASGETTPAPSTN